METRIVEIAERIKGLREMMDITPEEMAEAAGVELEEYLKHENGEQDFGFTFLYKCADKLDGAADGGKSQAFLLLHRQKGRGLGYQAPSRV